MLVVRPQPGQAVTMLVFGDVVIENHGGAENAVTLPGVATANVNMRSGPSTAYNIVSTVGIGAALIADGRQADNSWVHVQLENNLEGWVTAQYAALNGDLNVLPVMAAGESSGGYGPMQAFYVTTGLGDPTCAD